MPLRRINSTQSRELFSTLLTILLMFITDKRSFSRINLNYSNLSRSKTKHKKYLREIRSLQEINFRSSIFLGRDQQRWKTADGNMYWSLFEKYKLVNQSIAAGDITEKHFFSMQLHLFIICLNACLVSEYIWSYRSQHNHRVYFLILHTSAQTIEGKTQSSTFHRQERNLNMLLNHDEI